jgi:hypothetical protein
MGRRGEPHLNALEAILLVDEEEGTQISGEGHVDGQRLVHAVGVGIRAEGEQVGHVGEPA